MKILTILLAASVTGSAALPTQQQVRAIHAHGAKLNDLNNTLAFSIDFDKATDPSQQHMLLTNQGIYFIEQYTAILNSILETEQKLPNPDLVKDKRDEILNYGLTLIDLVSPAPLKSQAAGGKGDPLIDPIVAEVKGLRSDLQAVVPTLSSPPGPLSGQGPWHEWTDALLKLHYDLMNLDDATEEEVKKLEKDGGKAARECLGAKMLGQGLRLLQTDLLALENALQGEDRLAIGTKEVKDSGGNVTIQATKASPPDRKLWKQARSECAVATHRCVEITAHAIADFAPDAKSDTEPAKAVRALFARAKPLLDSMKDEASSLCTP